MMLHPDDEYPARHRPTKIDELLNAAEKCYWRERAVSEGVDVYQPRHLGYGPTIVTGDPA